MSHYQLIRERWLREANDRYHNGCGKEKTAKYHRNNQELLRGNER